MNNNNNNNNGNNNLSSHSEKVIGNRLLRRDSAQVLRRSLKGEEIAMQVVVQLHHRCYIPAAVAWRGGGGEGGRERERERERMRGSRKEREREGDFGASDAQ